MLFSQRFSVGIIPRNELCIVEFRIALCPMCYQILLIHSYSALRNCISADDSCSCSFSCHLITPRFKHSTKCRFENAIPSPSMPIDSTLHQSYILQNVLTVESYRQGGIIPLDALWWVIVTA